MTQSTVNGAYDIGIYVGKDEVTITGANVSGANNEGILVQDASNVVIMNSTIKNNATDLGPVKGGTSGKPLLSEDKGIVLAGSSACQVEYNVVEGNNHGGISVLDDGRTTYTFAQIRFEDLKQKDLKHNSIKSIGNLIMGNLIKDNLGDCGIVVSGKNAASDGGGVANNTISNNVIIGFDPAAGDTVPGVGAIVLGTGSVADSTVTNTYILNNTVDGGFIPGITLHCFGNGVISGTEIVGNALSNNGAGETTPPNVLPNDSPAKAGIEIDTNFGPATGITGTEVLKDTVSGDVNAVWAKATTDTFIDPTIVTGIISNLP